MRYPFAITFAAVFLAAPTVPALAQQIVADRTASRITAKAKAAAPARRALVAVRILDPIRVDGRLDELLWQSADAAGDFVEYEPAAGEPSSQRTEARVLYDDDAIYVGIRAFDTAPDSIVGQLARRDAMPYSDQLAVAIDSYFDRRTAFIFVVNPRGARADRMMYDDGAENDSWDPIWEVATRVDSLGWTAEYRIPLSQLRFSAPAGDQPQLWGIQFQRKIARTNETSLWAPMAREANGVVSHFGELHGLAGIRPRRNLEVLPYSVANVTRAPRPEGTDPFFEASAWRGSMGADFKYGITSNLTVSGTLNPDFGQVESDPSTVNLSAYETFLAEKRPFFVEGADIFNFGIGIGDGDLGNESLFYSRRIGRAPQGGTPDEAESSDVPTATTILGAAKLSGKTGGWSVGVLEAVTARESAPYFTESGEGGESVVEPVTNYTVARLSRDFHAGQTAVGGIFTATNRRIDDASLSFLRSAAYTGGLNARHRWAGGDYEVSGWLVGSHVRGDSAAIDRTQRSAARYFQRPDNDHTDYDPSRTSLSGWAANLQAGKMGGGNWRWITILNVKSPGLETNDLGFQQNADQVFHVWYVGYQQNKPGKYLNRWNLNTNQWNAWTFGGEHTEFGGNLNGGLQLKNFWGMNAGLNHDFATWSVDALRGGAAIRQPGNSNLWTNFYTDSRKPIQLRLGFGGNREEGTGGSNDWIEPSVRVRAGSQAEVSVGTVWQRRHHAWQYVDRVDGNAIFAGLDQTTAALVTRVNYTFSPSLSFQFYAQPFISAGAYGRFMRVSDPRAEAFEDRFERFAPDQVFYDADAERYTVDLDRDGAADLDFGQPDFNIKELRSNAVLRWEYRPGSTLYLVWSQGREQFDRRGEFRFGRDVGDLGRAKGTNVLLVKASWWVGL